VSEQHRARERRKIKEATRPGPRIPEAPETAAVKQDRVVEVFDDDPAEVYVSWHAEWGLRDRFVSTEDSSEDLAALVESVLSDLRSMTDRYIVRLEWVDPRRRSALRRDGGRGRRRAGCRLPEVVA
jgi:hypothetical protein